MLDYNIIALKPADAARAMGVSRATIYTLLREGKIRARKHGTRTLIDPESLRAYFASLPDYDGRSA